MSRHRYPLCPVSGKVRYGERKDIKLALRGADRDRSRARLNQVACNRREIRSYRCSDCRGWHLTSQPTRPIRLVPDTMLTSRTPDTASQAILRILAATEVKAGTAA